MAFSHDAHNFPLHMVRQCRIETFNIQPAR